MTAIKFQDLVTPQVETKATWGDSWAVNNDLQLLTASRAIASQDMDTATFRYRYGRVKLPTESAISNKTYTDFAGHWVRISLYDPADGGSYKLAWQGRFEVEDRDIHGKTGSRPASGILLLVAHGGYQLLRRQVVSDSVHMNTNYVAAADKEQRIGWLPPMNLRDERGTLVGNRSTTKGTANSNSLTSYLFGSNAADTPWNSFDFIEYLIRNHLPDGSNPVWVVDPDAHSVAVLTNLTDNFTFNDTMSVADILHRIIPRKYGVDFAIVPTDTGFKISVFSLQKDDATFDSVTIPANPNTRSIDAAALTDTKVKLEKTNTNRYKSIRVIGARVVCCGTFVFGGTSDQALYEGWSSTEETEYTDGSGDAADSAQQHDQARQRETMQNVFGRFVVNKNTGQLAAKYFPKVNDATNGSLDPAVKADQQSVIRETLTWLPLRKGWDYSGASPTPPADPANVADAEQDFMPPQAWLLGYDANPSAKWYGSDAEPQCSLRALSNEWGVQLKAQVNHLIAGANFTAPSDAPSRFKPAWTYDNMRITIAWQSDQRLALSYSLPDTPENDDAFGEMVVSVPDAELWYVAEGTVFDISQDGSTRKQTTQALTLRNDSERMKRAMAGAKARYTDPRYRAVINVNGLALWQDDVGKLITTVNDGTGDSSDLQSVVSRIHWDFENRHATIIQAGYAA